MKVRYETDQKMGELLVSVYKDGKLVFDEDCHEDRKDIEALVRRYPGLRLAVGR